MMLIKVTLYEEKVTRTKIKSSLSMIYCPFSFYLYGPLVSMPCYKNNSITQELLLRIIIRCKLSNSITDILSIKSSSEKLDN